MKKTIQKLTAMFIAITILISCNVTGTFAANKSPQEGNIYQNVKIIKKVGIYQGYKNGTAALVGIQKSKQSKLKLKTIFNSIIHKGKRYNMCCVPAKAFDKCTKLKTVKIKWTTMKGKVFSKNAFKNLSKSQISKIKVKVNKKMPKKEFKKLKKALAKAGIKKKNIKKVKI